MSITSKNKRNFFAVLFCFLWGFPFIYGMSQDDLSLPEKFLSKCEFTVHRQGGIYPAFVEIVFSNPSGYIAEQVREICRYKTGKKLILGICNVINEDSARRVKFIFSEEKAMSGDVEDGNGVVFINLSKCIFERGAEGKFPSIYSIVPVVQGKFKLGAAEHAGHEVDVAKIAPDKSPFWLSVAHELIHVLRKLSDPHGSSKHLRSTPQNVIKAGERTLYPEFGVPRLSYELWTNKEERETVVGGDISELRLRQESGQKIRYIYQSAEKVFFEPMSVVCEICGGESNIPTIIPSYEGGFDFGLTPLPILASMFDKKHLLEHLVGISSGYISANIGKSMIDLKKLGFLPDITDDCGNIKEKRMRKLGKLIGCVDSHMPLVSGMSDEFGLVEHNYSVRSVSHCGDCGYIALGISRQALATMLQEYLQEHVSANDPIRRELLWQLGHMPQQDKAALAKLGGVEIENYIEYFIRLSADEFRENPVVSDHNVGGVINTWVNYLDLGDGFVSNSREEQHGLGTIIATLLQRPITVLVQGDVGRYIETFTPLSEVVITELLETTRGGSGSIGLFCREGDAHFDILLRKDEKVE